MDTNFNLLDASPEALKELCLGLGEKAFRAGQIYHWLWGRGVDAFAAMTDLSKPFRERLAESARIDRPSIAAKVESADGTVKLALRLADGALVETVLIPEKDHYTLCLSTQVGCALGCRFCATGSLGFNRDMTPGEILSQPLLARRVLAEKGVELPLRNLVFMGMGEPLLNLDNVIAALKGLHHPQGLDFSGRRITTSTVGIPKGLKILGEAGLCSLAVSLHAPNQELRAEIMPQAAKIPLPELLDALRVYPLKPRQRITFEYVLLGGVNDSPVLARDLVRLLSRHKAKVNLIAYNPPKSPGFSPPFAASTPARIEAFQNVLREKHLANTLRRSKGADVGAACGQLALSENTPKA